MPGATAMAMQLYFTRPARPYHNGSNICHSLSRRKNCNTAILLSPSTKEPKLYENVNKKPSINQEIINLMKSHLMHIG